MVLATAKIEDFDRFWNTFSTKGAEKRKQHGSGGSHVFRDPTDDTRVWMVFDWDADGFRNYTSDPDLPAIQEEAGLQGRPQMAELAREHDAQFQAPTEERDRGPRSRRAAGVGAQSRPSGTESGGIGIPVSLPKWAVEEAEGPGVILTRVMSQENVDLLREITERLNRKDIPGVLRLMDPEIRFQHRVAELEGTFTGVDAVRDWFADVAQHFHDWKIDCDDFRDLGDRVLALGTLRAVGKESRVETEMPYTVVAKSRNGLVTHYTDYGDRERALEAAGLSE